MYACKVGRFQIQTHPTLAIRTALMWDQSKCAESSSAETLFFMLRSAMTLILHYALVKSMREFFGPFNSQMLEICFRDPKQMSIYPWSMRLFPLSYLQNHEQYLVCSHSLRQVLQDDGSTNLTGRTKDMLPGPHRYPLLICFGDSPSAFLNGETA